MKRAANAAPAAEEAKAVRVGHACVQGGLQLFPRLLRLHGLLLQPPSVGRFRFVTEPGEAGQGSFGRGHPFAWEVHESEADLGKPPVPRFGNLVNRRFQGPAELALVPFASLGFRSQTGAQPLANPGDGLACPVSWIVLGQRLTAFALPVEPADRSALLRERRPGPCWRPCRRQPPALRAAVGIGRGAATGRFNVGLSRGFAPGSQVSYQSCTICQHARRAARRNSRPRGNHTEYVPRLRKGEASGGCGVSRQ